MDIYVLHGDKQLGPYTVGEINDRLVRGQLAASTLAWFDGSPGWVLLAAIPGVSEMVSSAPRSSSEDECADSIDSANGESAGSSVPLDLSTSGGASAPMPTTEHPQGAATVRTGGMGGTAPRLPLDHQDTNGGRLVIACLIVLCAGALVWAFIIGPVSLNDSRGKPGENPDRTDTTHSQATNSGDERPTATPASAPVAASNRSTPAADAADATAGEGYLDPVVEAYLKLSPQKRAEADRQMSRAESEKIWLYYFKGRDAGGHPVPYTVEERKANALAASTACKLAQQQLDSFFVRRDDDFFTGVRSGDGDSSTWYLRQYKDATFRVSQDRLTDIERMNGWQWRGVVYYNARLTRTFTGKDRTAQTKVPLQMSDWFSGSTFLRVALQCRSGKWTITNNEYVQEFAQPTDDELRALDNTLENLVTIEAQKTAQSPTPLYAVRQTMPPYPHAAKVQHIQGSGVCHVVFGGNGRVTSAAMKKSTGSDILDSSTIGYIKETWMGMPDSTRDVEVVYRLQ